MIIRINSGSRGWGRYILHGTKENPRDSSKVELLDGDISLGDFYSKNNKYKDSYYTVILGFKGKPNREIIEAAYNDFKEHFFKGLRKDEYHIDAVIHYDTDDTHIHARIPKQNLLTNTHLQLYYDKIDRRRKELIQDFISLKYGFEIARETNKEIVKEQSHEYINKWREERKQKPFEFSKKKARAEAEKQINNYISELITSGMIEKQEDIKTVLEELGLEVVKFDRDYKKDFAYVTVQNSTGKMRVKGEFYGRDFFSYSTKDRITQIKSNQRDRKNTEPTNDRFVKVQQELRRANEKRYKKVTELFRASRERAIKELRKTREVHRDTKRKNIRSARGENLHQDRRLEDETYRAAAFQRDREIRRKRVKALKDARNARIKLFRKIAEHANKIREESISNSEQLRVGYSEHANKIREEFERTKGQQQRIIEESGNHITTAQDADRYLGRFTKLREFGERIERIKYISIYEQQRIIEESGNHIATAQDADRYLGRFTKLREFGRKIGGIIQSISKLIKEKIDNKKVVAQEQVKPKQMRNIYKMKR